MVVTFLSGLLNEECSVSASAVDNIYTELFPLLATKFSLKRVLSAFARKIEVEGEWIEKFARALAKVLYHGMKLDLRSDTERILSNISLETDQILLQARKPIHAFRCFFFPLLLSLARMLEANTLTTLASPYQQLFGQVLSSSITRYVGLESKPQKDWARANVECICKDCRALNNFLSSPTEDSLRLARNGERRIHLKFQAREIRGVKTTEERTALVITKDHTGYQSSYKKWANRCDYVRKCLASWPSQYLKEILIDKYDVIMSLDVNALLPASTAAEEMGKLSVQAPDLIPTYSNRRLEDPRRRLFLEQQHGSS